MQKKILQAIGAILICNFAGIIGSIFTSPAIETWYNTLNRPGINPPNWLFGPVWITLYTLMGISLFLIWNKRKETKKVYPALIIFGVQLTLNALWSIIFFGFNAIGYAFVEILLLDIMIVATIITFYTIDKKAAYLLIPYWMWVLFATILNANYFILN